MAETIREKAARARRLAAFAYTPEDRTLLLEIAETFERQVGEAERSEAATMPADPRAGSADGSLCSWSAAAVLDRTPAI